MRYFAAISLSLLTVSPVVVSCETSDAAVRAAIVDAVKARVGADAEVVVEQTQVFTRERDICRGASACQATPDPTARLGRTVRFTLSAIRRDGPTVHFERVGAAEAIVYATTDAAQATTTIRRGDLLTAGNIESIRQPLAGMPLRRTATAAELSGAKALRDIAPGELVVAGMVLVPPAIRTGQHVTALSRVGGVEVSATLLAAESGVTGDIIRIVNPDSRRALRARILSSSKVEIVR
jgi:flagella basal body P-ring formation protein FlgA